MSKENIVFDLSSFGINDIRIIVLVETKPLSSHFEQLEITQEQYKRLSQFLMYFYHPVFDKDGNAEFDVKTTEFEVNLPENIQPYKI